MVHPKQPSAPHNSVLITGVAQQMPEEFTFGCSRISVHRLIGTMPAARHVRQTCHDATATFSITLFTSAEKKNREFGLRSVDSRTFGRKRRSHSVVLDSQIRGEREHNSCWRFEECSLTRVFFLFYSWNIYDSWGIRGVFSSMLVSRDESFNVFFHFALRNGLAFHGITAVKQFLSGPE